MNINPNLSYIEISERLSNILILENKLLDDLKELLKMSKKLDKIGSFNEIVKKVNVFVNTRFKDNKSLISLKDSIIKEIRELYVIVTDLNAVLKSHLLDQLKNTIFSLENTILHKKDYYQIEVKNG